MDRSFSRLGALAVVLVAVLVSAPGGAAPSGARPPSLVPSAVPRPVFVPDCATRAADQTFVSDSWAVYPIAKDAAYANRPCNFFVADVTFTPTANRKSVFTTYLYQPADQVAADASQGACESYAATLQVLVQGEPNINASSKGQWVNGKCILGTASTPPVPMKQKFRLLGRRTINGVAVPVTMEAKQIL